MPTYAYEDNLLAIDPGKYTRLRELAGSNETAPEYVGVYNIDSKQGVSRVTIFYPEYYRAMSVRLFNFDGQKVKSPGCPIIIYTEKNNSKVIKKMIDSPSYEDAVKYVENNKLPEGEKYALGGTDPFLSCIDLPEVVGIVPLKGFGGVDLGGMSQAVKQTYEVNIFKYTGEFE
jgi:hypothetical protein